MSKLKMDAYGLPGVTYEFGGRIQRIVLPDGTKVRLAKEPWKLETEDLVTVSRQLSVSIDVLEDALLRAHDKVKAQPKEKQAGKSDTMEVTWADAVKCDAKGNPVALNNSIVARLLCKEIVHIDEMLLQVKNNVAKPLTKDMLKLSILLGLTSVGAQELYNGQTANLVHDQLLPYVKEAVLGDRKGFLPAQNGVIDIMSNEIIETNDIYLKAVNCDFDPSAKDCPKIMKLFDNAFLPEQKELVLSILGAAISGRKAPYILMMAGEGRNGKSQIREIVSMMMKDLMTGEKLENIHENFVNQVFLGKLICWNSEVSSSRKFADQCKDITGGTSIVVRQKFQNGEIQAPMQAVVVLDSNSPCHFDSSAAFQERTRFISMPRKFVMGEPQAPNEISIDVKLMDNLESEIPAFLNVLLGYSRYYLEHGRLKHDIANTLDQMQERSSLITGFIDAYCDTESGGNTGLNTVAKYLKVYAKSLNVAAPEVDQLRYKLKNEYGFKINGNQVIGLVLRKDKKLA